MLSDVNGDRRRFIDPHASRIEPAGLPWTQTVRDPVLRKPIRVRGRVEGFACNFAGGDVLAMSVAELTLKPRNHDERSILSDDANNLFKYVGSGPLVPGFGHALGIPIVDGRGEVLPINTVVLIGCQQFFRAD